MSEATRRRNSGRQSPPTHPRVGMQEAREDFSDFVNRVGFGGERIVFTRQGKDLVALVSIDDLNRLDSLHSPKGGTTVSARAAKSPLSAAS